METISDTIVKKARKIYLCSACNEILRAFGSFRCFIEDCKDLLSDGDIEALRIAESKDCRIQIGEPYRRVYADIGNGKPELFTSMIDIDTICNNCDVYEE